MSRGSNILKLFKNLETMEESKKYRIADILNTIIDSLSYGVPCHGIGGVNGPKQCAFCCRSTESEHMAWCAVTLAREIKENYL